MKKQADIAKSAADSHQSQADKNAHAEAVAVLNGRPSEVDRQKALEKLANLSDSRRTFGRTRWRASTS